MRLAAYVLPGQFRKNPLYLVVAIVLFFYLAYKLAQYVLAGDLVGLAYVALGVVLAASLSTILSRWRTGLYIFLGWLFFEDLARKYLGNNMAIYFGKDILVGMVYLSFSLAYRKKEVQTFTLPFRLPLLLFFWFGLIQVFNPASTSLFYGILGMKLYFYYIPLIFVGYALIDKESDLQKFYPYLLGLFFVVALLGIAQSILGHTFLNPTIMADDIRELGTNYRVAPISGVIVYRPTSVFVSNGRFAFFLVPAWLFAFGYGGYLILRTRQGRIFTLLSLGAITVAIAMAASRGTLLWTMGSAVVCVAAFMWGSPLQRGQLVRVLRSFQRALIIAILSLGLAIFLFPTEVTNRFIFYWETLSLTSPNSELLQRTGDYPIRNFLYAFDNPRWPYGFGIGTASLGTQYVSRIFHVPFTGFDVESGYGSIVVELGVVGLFLWLVMTFAIVISAWKVVRKLKGTVWFPIGFVIFWYASLLLFPYTYEGLSPFEDFILNSLLWLSLGILFRLPKLSGDVQASSLAAGSAPAVRTI
ncbi:MAG TPA: hypothetical protein VJX70_01850 [Candidatus Acidoferrum sp.]|nr:hypothetical protein [Candidatus Acidoferrum sp.]